MPVVGSEDATKEGSLCVVTAMGAIVEGPRAYKCGGVGCPVNSLKEAPRLLETEVSGTSSDDVCADVKHV